MLAVIQAAILEAIAAVRARVRLKEERGKDYRFKSFYTILLIRGASLTFFICLESACAIDSAFAKYVVFVDARAWPDITARCTWLNWLAAWLHRDFQPVVIFGARYSGMGVFNRRIVLLFYIRKKV